MTDNQQPAQPSQQPKHDNASHRPVKLAKPKIFSIVSEKLEKYKRTIEIARKPDKEEFLYSARTSAFGIFLIGMIGFILFVVYNLLLRALGA